MEMGDIAAGSKKKEKKSKKSKKNKLGAVEPASNGKYRQTPDGYIYKAGEKINSDDDSDVDQSVDEMLEDKIKKNKKKNKANK